MKAALADAPNMEGANLVTQVGSTKIYQWNEKLDNKPVSLSKDAPHVVVIDCGAKYQILRYLNEQGLA
ncbi:MAG: hypothetical protein R2877_04895 [Bdellovibrionota bacterium]